MPDIKAPIALTHATIEKLSRHDMLKWVNTTVQAEYKKIEELCSGVAYCQMMELLFPQSVCMKKVKLQPKLEHEYLHNLKQFQLAFTRINYEKSVPIERLMKGRFQDNFEFLQWFKKFFDVHANGKENLKIIAPLKDNIRKKSVEPKQDKESCANGVAKCKEADSTKLILTPPRAHSTHVSEAHMVSPNSLLVLQQSYKQLLDQIKIIQHESNYYYKKLTAIEKLISEALDKGEHAEWSKKCQEILYAVDPVSTTCGKVELVSAEL